MERSYRQRDAIDTSSAETSSGEAGGWVRYHEHGFSFLAPSGFKPAPDSGVSGLPKTASVRFLTLAGQPLQKTSDQLMLGFNSKLQSTSTR